MEKSTEGAWVVHHAKKLQTVVSQDFDQISFAGKCGILLSGLSESTDSILTKTKVEALARANGISPKSELPSLLEELKRQRLIDVSEHEINTIGLTTQKVLDHTSSIFTESNPSIEEKILVDIAEKVSEAPAYKKDLIEELSDGYLIPQNSVEDLFEKNKIIGFVDSEKNSSDKELIFNGNLFKIDNVKKIHVVMNSLSAVELQTFQQINEMLRERGCLHLSELLAVMSKELFAKLHSIGLYDVNKVGNEAGNHYFITRPSAFSKFTNNSEDDTFDLAKALVAALSYGIHKSSTTRGRILSPRILINKLIQGRWVGPAPAIGQDYQALEMKGVIEVKKDGWSCMMRLRKPEVGRMALNVISNGEAISEELVLPNTAMTSFVGPEDNRTLTRKNNTEPLKRSIGIVLNELRTGALS